MERQFKKKGKRILAVVLSLLIVMGTFDYSGSMEVNAQTKNEKKIITAIADLDSSVTEQTLSIGAQESDIQFPETLQVTVETISEEPETEEPETEELETEISTEETATESSTEEVGVEEPVTEVPAEEPSTEENTTEVSTGKPAMETATELESEEELESSVEEGNEEANIVTSLWNEIQNTFVAETVYAAEVEEIEVTWELVPEYSVKDAFDGGVTLEDYFGVDENGDIDYNSATQEQKDAYEDMNGAYYTYRAVLPDTDDEGNRYTLAEGVELPEIYVQIGESGVMLLDTALTKETAYMEVILNGDTNNAQYYGKDDFTAAWNAVYNQDNAKLTFLKETDISRTSNSGWNFATENITVDLNGQKINYTTSDTSCHLFWVTTGSLTMEDSVGGGTVTTNLASILYLQGTGSITVNGGTYINNSTNQYDDGIMVDHGEVHITGGTFKCVGGSGLRQYFEDAKIYLSGGSFSSTNGNALHAAEGKYVGDFIPSSGYVFKMNGTEKDYSGTKATGSGTVTVESTDFPFALANSFKESENKDGYINVVKASVSEDAGNITIKSMILTDESGSGTPYTTNSDTLSGIPAGTYKVVIETKEGQSYTAPLSHTVTAAVARVGTDEWYATVSTALAAAGDKDSATVTLLVNCTVDSTIEISKGDITLTIPKDLTLTLDVNKYFNITTGGTLTLDEAGTLKGNTQYGEGLLAVNGGALVITNGTYINNGNGEKSRCVRLTNSGSVTISGGTFETTSGKAIYSDITTIDGMIAKGYCAVSGDVVNDRGQMIVHAEGDKGPSKVTVKQNYISSFSIAADETSVGVGYTSAQAPTLTASVIHADNPPTDTSSYQWYRGEAGGSGTKIEGATSDRYTLETGLAQGEYQYYCTYAINGCIAESNTVTVTVTKKLTADMFQTIGTQYYKGTDTQLQPAVTATTESKLTTDDYTVKSYGANNAVGETAGSVTVSGIGIYSGDVTLYFDIAYAAAPSTILYNGTATKADCYGSAVTISANGYTVSDAPDGDYKDSYSLNRTNETDGTTEKTLYFKQNDTGYIAKVESVSVVIDTTAPTGTVEIGKKVWENFLEAISFGKYHVSNTITITASDTVSGVDVVSGVDKIFYLISDEAIDKDSLKNSNAWIAYSSNPTIAENSKQIVYAKLVDKVGNTAYISSDGVIVDTTAPVISNLAFKTDDSLKDTQADFSFQINEEGSYYYVVLQVGEEGTPAAGTPIAADIIVTAGGTQTDGNTITGAAASGTGTVATAALSEGKATISCTAAGLSPNHSYKVYVVAQDDVYNISASADGTLEHNTSSVSGSTAVTTKKTTPVITTTPALSGTYGMKVEEMTFSGGEVKAGDIVIKGTWSVTDAAKTNVPTVTAETAYQITFTPGEGYGDYAEVTTSVTPEVAKKAVTVTADNKTKTYNTANPDLTFTVPEGALVTGDEKADLKVTLTTTAVTDSPVGTYPITGSGSADSNYEVTVTSGTLKVTQATSTITIAEGSKTFTKIYGDEPFVLTGITKTGDGSLSYTVTDSRNAADKGVADNKVITVAADGTVTIVGAGTATINVNMAATTNYTVAESQTISVTVEKKSLTDGTGSRSYAYTVGSNGAAVQIDIPTAGSLPEAAKRGTTSYTLGTVIDSNSILVADSYSVDSSTGVLSYKVSSNLTAGAVGDTATIPVIVTMDNYKDYTYTLTITITDKLPVELQSGSSVTISGSGELTYGEALSDLGFNNAVFVERGTSTVVEGTLAWINGGAKLDAGNITAGWIFTPAAKYNGLYETVTGNVDIVVNQETGIVSNKTDGGYQTAYTFTGNEITAPASTNFTTNSGSTDFTFTWYKDSVSDGNKLSGITRPSAVGSYILKVDVASTTNYTAATLNLNVKVNAFTTDAVATLAYTNAGTDGWYHGDVTVTAPDDYTISTTQGKDSFGTNSSLEISGDRNGDYTYYLKQDGTGYISEAKTITVKIDTKNPTGSIGVKQTWWQSFLKVVTFGLYTNEQETVTISAKDEEGTVNSGIGTVEYYISETAYTSEDSLKNAGGITWNSYNSNDKPKVPKNTVSYVYARVTDKAGNVSYISTDGIVYDTTAPTLTLAPAGDEYQEVTTGNTTKAYAGTVTVTVTADDAAVTEQNTLDSIKYKLDNGTETEITSGETFQITGRGSHSVTVTATDKAGNVTTQTLTVRIYGAAPTITIMPADSIVYDGAVIAEGTDFTLNKDGSAGTVTYFHKVQGTGDETYVSGLPVNAGNYTIKAVVAEDSTGCYQEAEQTADLTITKAQPAVTLNAIVNRTGGKTINLTATVAPVSGGTVPTGTVKFYDTTTGSDVEISAETLVNGTATYSYTGLATQIYKIKALYEGNANYTTASSAEQSVDTAKQNQETLSIQSISAKTYGDAAFELAATGGSGTGEVTFASSDESVLSISGTTATIHKAGTVTITAVKAADDNYNEAAAQTRVTIGKKALTITADDRLNVISGSAMPTFTYTTSGLVNGDTITGAPTMTTTVTDTSTTGTYAISINGAVISNPDGYAVTYKAGTLTIVDSGTSDTPDTKPTTPEITPTTPDTTPITPETTPDTTPTITPTQPAATSQQTEQSAVPTATPADTQAPFIEGKNGEQGWDVIKSDITDAFLEALEDAGVDISAITDKDGKIDLDKLAENPEILEALSSLKEPLSVTVNMNGSTELPADIISLIAGKNIDLTLELEEGISWTINGNSVTGENFSDIDLAVTKNSTTIPVDIINEVSGESYTMQIELSHNGEFGFTATLTINLESKNAGCYANLFYFNEETEALEFMGYGQIDEDGNAELEFTHASAYTIVITEEPMDEEAAAGAGDTLKTSGSEDTETSGTNVEAAGETKGGLLALWILLGIAVVVVIGGTIIFAAKKKGDKSEE